MLSRFRPSPVRRCHLPTRPVQIDTLPTRPLECRLFVVLGLPLSSTTNLALASPIIGEFQVNLVRNRKLGSQDFLDSLFRVHLILKRPAEVAQLVEHGTENAGVDSSILSLGTAAAKPRYFVAGIPSNCLSSSQFAGIACS